MLISIRLRAVVRSDRGRHVAAVMFLQIVCLSRFFSVANGGTFHVNDLPNLKWWASASDSQLGANSNGTGTVLPGGSVGYVSDLSGNGNNLFMGNGVVNGGDTFRPTYQANFYENTPGIGFNGVNNLLSLTAPLANGATEFTLALVLGGPASPGGTANNWWGSFAGSGAATVSTNPYGYFATANGGTLSVYGSNRYTLSANDSELLMIVRMKQGGPVEFWQNGVLRGTGTWPTGTNNSILSPQKQLLGGYITATNPSLITPANVSSMGAFAKGSFLEGVATNSYLSDSQLADLTQYLTRKWPAVQDSSNSPNVYDPVGGHVQGVALSPTEKFVFHTSTITKYDSQWNSLNSYKNPNVFAGLPTTYGKVAHMGDGAYANGMLFAPLEVDFGYVGKYIGVYDATKPGMPLLGYRDISPQHHEVSSMTIAPDTGAHGIMFVTSFYGYAGGSKLWMYDYEDGNIASPHFGDFLGSADIPANITGIQGVTYHNGFLYFSEDSWNIDRVRWLGSTIDSTSEHVYKGFTTVQGIAADENALYLTYQSGSTTEYIETLTTGQLATLPEPSTNGMMLCGAALLLAFAAWRKRAASRMLRQEA